MSYLCFPPKVHAGNRQWQRNPHMGLHKAQAIHVHQPHDGGRHTKYPVIRLYWHLKIVFSHDFKE